MNELIATVLIHVSDDYKPIMIKIYKNSNISLLIEDFVKKCKLTNEIYTIII
jgi:hypothetical protein